MLPALSNLKIEVEAAPDLNPQGEIYAKVLDAPAAATGLSLIRFTSVSPELKNWIQKTVNQLASMPAAVEASV